MEVKKRYNIGDYMKVGDKVQFDNKDYTITHIEDRNTYPGEALKGVKLIGDVVILQDDIGKKILVYDFDL